MMMRMMVVVVIMMMLVVVIARRKCFLFRGDLFCFFSEPTIIGRREEEPLEILKNSHCCSEKREKLLRKTNHDTIDNCQVTAMIMMMMFMKTSDETMTMTTNEVRMIGSGGRSGG